MIDSYPRRIVRMLGIVGLALTSLAANADVLFVNHAATGGNDGTSWADAYDTLSAALAAASSGDEIWVAQGLYVGAYYMKFNVDFYGGFVGDEVTRSERDWVNNVTHLDSTGFPDTSDGGTVTGHDAILDGFTITGPNKGVNVVDGPTQIRNCIIRDNGTFGVLMTGATDGLVIDNCLIYNNNLGFIDSGLVECFIVNSTIVDNITQEVQFQDQSEPTIVNSIIYPTGINNFFEVSFAIDYSLIGSSSSGIIAAGTGLITDEAPQFVDPSTGNYRLLPSSPGVNEGFDAGFSTFDYEKRTRGLEGAFDMGAFEYDPNGDLDMDGIPDAIEGSADPDLDGKPNLGDTDSDGDTVGDVYEGTYDRDGDNIADYLDLDRDEDGNPDATDTFVTFVQQGLKGLIEDGLTWATAYSTIQEAVDIAYLAGINAGGGEVWIAAGTYGEQRELFAGTPPVNSGAVFLQESVGLFGGFDGTEETLEERDLVSNVTIIDGSTSRDGNAAFHVIVAASGTSVDSLTITGGRATGTGSDANGAGLYSTTDPPTMVNGCKFIDNRANALGGGYFANAGSATLSNSLFLDNASTAGGGIYSGFAKLTILNSTFYGNQNIPGNEGGSAFFVPAQDVTTFKNNIFWSNDDPVAFTPAKATSARMFFFNNNLEPGFTYGTGGVSQVFQDGGGNIGVDPQFVNAGANDFRIRVTSPSFRTGKVDGDTPEKDILGATRDVDVVGEVDMGAYEVSNLQDLDSDNIPDYIEGGGNEDGDGDPNYLDEDSDGDGIDDIDEGTGNPDADGKPNFLDTDSDGDGVLDEDEGSVDTDNDSTPDYLDLDSDDDDLSDHDEEFNLPTSRIDDDSDDDTLLDGAEINIHGTDPLDKDSDDDLLFDNEEVNTYGTNPNVKDSDGDDLNDFDEVNVHNTNPNEEDSDEDTLLDGDEVNIHNTNPNAGDSDEDTLRDDAEINVHGTNPNEPDTDDDGMRDDYEVANGLNPLVKDANADPDMDGFTNIQERDRGSDPQDDNSPYRTLFVSTSGNDLLNDGSESSPLATIAKAMELAASDIGAAEDNFLTINVAVGIYDEPVFFVPHVEIVGNGNNTIIRHFDAADLEHFVVSMAENTKLSSVTVTLPTGTTDDTFIIRIDNVEAHIDNVIVDGGSNPVSTGIFVTGSGSSNSTILNSTIKRITTGIHVIGSAVRIARNAFEFINNGNAIFIAFTDGTKGQLQAVAPGLGDGIDLAQTAFNRFRNIDGFFINIDESAPITTIAEYNDWGVDTAEEIAAKISLPQKGTGTEVDFEPFLKSRIVPSTVIVPLFIDGATDTDGKPVPVPASANPAVTIPSLSAIAERDPGTGVHLFPSVPTGSYALSATADSYNSDSATVNANGNVITSLVYLSEMNAEEPNDLDGDGNVNSTDIQLLINTVLGLISNGNADVNNDGTTNASDIQLIINAVLGIK